MCVCVESHVEARGDACGFLFPTSVCVETQGVAANSGSEAVLCARLFSCIMASADLAAVDSALRFLMDEAGVSGEGQKKVYASGFDSLRSFAGIDESAAGVREALKQMGLDASTNLAMRKDVALLVSVWESSRTQRSYQEKNKQEARVGGQLRLVQTTEYAAMRSAVEQTLGRLKDKEAPSKSLVAAKLEQVEDGAPIAEDLREATSFEDAEVEAYSAVIDPGSNTLKIRPGKCSTTPPRTPEELRLRHRRLGLAWAFIRTRHSNRKWVPANVVEAFRKFSDYVLGNTVAGLCGMDGLRPTWPLILSYELELRKAAYRFVRDGLCDCIGAALEKACETPALYSVHFVTPMQLGKMEPVDDSLPPAPPIQMDLDRGSKGKGKGKWTRQWGKSSQAPDGRKICFAYNKPSGCHQKACSFAHICQRCFAKHSFQQCRHKKPSDKAHQPGRTEAAE